MEPFVRARSSFVPAYLETYEIGELKEKVDEALEALRLMSHLSSGLRREPAGG